MASGSQTRREEESTHSASRIRRVVITPVAFHDPPLLNAVGAHEPFALRSIIEVETEDGVVGLGESYGDLEHLERLRRVAELVRGLDVFAIHELFALVARALGGEIGADRHGLTGAVTRSGTVLRVASAFEVAYLDAQGRLLDRPVSDLLGGAVRQRVPFSGYLFYKWAAHPGEAPDRFGEALDAEGLVAQAHTMIARYGFHSLKLKGGVLAPDEEVRTIRALRDAFPDAALRLDPNTAWSVETSIRVGRELDGLLEYLEDPTASLSGMANVARSLATPLATNMCVVNFDDLAPAVDMGSVGVVLADHHYWGGLRKTQELATLCAAFGLELSMHSNSHLGVSLAAMTHVASVVPSLSYDLDTHWPWKEEGEDLIESSVEFRDGSLAVPSGPGLGIELDRDALARLHEQYERCGVRVRDDTAYRRRVEPGFKNTLPRW